MSKMALFHGSTEVIDKPFYGGGRMYNDYGMGFYCTEHVELAREWACTESKKGYVNKYEIDVAGLKVLDLESEEYTILHWLSILIENRNIQLQSPVIARGKEWIGKNFSVDVSKYDLISGYRADDAYFSFARAFLRNEITVQQLSLAMRLGELGVQKVIRSKKAFSRVEFKGYEQVDCEEYYLRRVERNERAKKDYLKLLEQEDSEGRYLSDLIREGVSPDDLRL